MENTLPSIPAKRYFTIGEVGDLCGVKPHVLRYWEQEFTQLRPMKRRGNRRYYQHHEVQMIRKIRDLLYEQGFTISGARNKMQEIQELERDKKRQLEGRVDASVETLLDLQTDAAAHFLVPTLLSHAQWQQVRDELLEIRAFLVVA
jgi:DNA-binding transcriptional MerR regulator